MARRAGARRRGLPAKTHAGARKPAHPLKSLRNKLRNRLKSAFWHVLFVKTGCENNVALQTIQVSGQARVSAFLGSACAGSLLAHFAVLAGIGSGGGIYTAFALWFWKK
jgi:hypothetical protein